MHRFIGIFILVVGSPCQDFLSPCDQAVLDAAEFVIRTQGELKEIYPLLQDQKDYRRCFQSHLSNFESQPGHQLALKHIESKAEYTDRILLQQLQDEAQLALYHHTMEKLVLTSGEKNMVWCSVAALTALAFLVHLGNLMSDI